MVHAAQKLSSCALHVLPPFRPHTHLSHNLGQISILHVLADIVVIDHILPLSLPPRWRLRMSLTE